MFGFGTAELIIVAIIVIVLFSSHLPRAMYSIGRGMFEFRNGVRSLDGDEEHSERTQ